MTYEILTVLINWEMPMGETLEYVLNSQVLGGPYPIVTRHI